MESSADAPHAEAAAEESRGEELARTLGLTAEGARRLVKAGYTSAEAVRGLSSGEIDKIGLAADDRKALRPKTAASPAPSKGAKAKEAKPKEAAEEPIDAERIVERWMGSVGQGRRTRLPKLSQPNKRSTEILKRWVDGDDRALEDWIRTAEAEGPGFTLSPAAPAASSPTPGSAEAAKTATLLEREATVVRWLTNLLDRVKSDQFDPAALLQEVQELHRHLYEERARRRQLEEQIEHIKRGSIAVIKYVRSREAKGRETASAKSKAPELSDLKRGLGTTPSSPEDVRLVRDLAPPPPGSATRSAEAPPTAEEESRLRAEFSERERQFIDRETELRRRLVQLEGENRRLSTDLTLAKHQVNLPKGQDAAVDAEIARRLDVVAEKERNLVARENEVRMKFEETRLGAEENERRRGPLEFKEKELSAYDLQLQTRREALDLEARRLEALRKELGEGTVVKASEAQRIDEIRNELAKKEAELRGREAKLTERIREAERLAGVAANTEAERLHAESVADARENRIASGVRRLDDLMYGGFPLGAQILLNGPAHTGKDVLARLFSVEGLRRKVPSIWVVTDKTFGQVREDLQGLYPSFPQAEREGLLRYVDMYSLAVGPTTPTSGVKFLSPNDKTVADQLNKAVDSFAEQLKEKFSTYRLVFESVSTLTAYLDTAATFRFLQPFVGRRKLDGAVGYYELESGMHTEADVETLEHMVDGSLNLKIDQMKTFLSVRGIGDAQARTWIGYTFTKRSFNLGSFSLEHIR